MHTVIGVFDDKTAASRALETLKSSGFSDSSLQVNGARMQDGGTSHSSSTADEGMLAEIGGFFSKLFGDEDKTNTKAYSEAVRRGGYVVTVDVANDEEFEAVAATLDSAGAYDIDERTSQWKTEGWESSDADSMASGIMPTPMPMPIDSQATSTPAMSSEQIDVDNQAVLPVIQEELKVGKRVVQRGGVRVVQRVTETPVNDSVSLTEEHATIERRPVNRVATAADMSGLRDVSIEVRETAEEAVISKEARVVEEVVVGKAATEHVENVSDTVRRTDVEVEHFADASTAAAPSRVTMSTTASSADDVASSDWKAGQGPQGGL